MAPNNSTSKSTTRRPRAAPKAAAASSKSARRSTARPRAASLPVAAPKPPRVSVDWTQKRDKFEWDLLPTVLADRIFNFLRTDKGCDDLVSLRQVSRHLKNGVDAFMGFRRNRAAIARIDVSKEGERRVSLTLKVSMHWANGAFHLEQIRELPRTVFTRGSEVVNGEKMFTVKVRVPLDGRPALTMTRVRDLLDTHIVAAYVNGLREATDLALVAQMLDGGASVARLNFTAIPVDDVTGPELLSIVERSSATACAVSVHRATLTDPGAFFARLDSLCKGGLQLRESSRAQTNLFGLPRDHWEHVLETKVASFRVFCDQQEFTVALVDLSTFDINAVEWSMP